MTATRPLAAAVLAALLALFYLWDKERVERGALQAALDSRLLAFDPASATSVDIVNAFGAVRLERAEGRWWIAGPPRELADAAQVDALLGNVQGAKRTSRVDRPEEDYGFEPPAARVSIAYAEAGAAMEAVVEFGTARAQAGRVYARVPGEDVVFSVGDWVLRQAARAPGDWRSRLIAPAMPADPRALSFEKPGGAAVALERGDGGWVLDAPGGPVPADTAMVDKVIESLRSGRFSEIREASPAIDPRADAPSLVVRADGAEVLRLGAPFPGPPRGLLAPLEGGRVGIAPESLVSELLRPVDEWRTKRFFWRPVEQWRRVELASGRTRTVLSREADWRDELAPGVALNPRKVADLLLDLHDLRALAHEAGPGITEEQLAEYALAEPSLALRVEYADGSSEGFQLGASDTAEGAAYMRRLQDDTVWRVALADAGNFYRFRAQLEERRLRPGLAAEATRVEMASGGNRIELAPAADGWEMRLSDARAVTVPAGMATAFLEQAEDIEWDSELFAPDEDPGRTTLDFFRDGEAQPFFRLAVLRQLGDAEDPEILVRADGRLFLVKQEEFLPFYEAFRRLLDMVPGARGTTP
ncbi:MAG: DUF4340 domain-containing protein [Candidatus Sumerlaeia bacterium]|nr:DUF4340 domain-containing protein [Candidatus Sumerlaeia bacterium]